MRTLLAVGDNTSALCEHSARYLFARRPLLGCAWPRLCRTRCWPSACCSWRRAIFVTPKAKAVSLWSADWCIGSGRGTRATWRAVSNLAEKGRERVGFAWGRSKKTTESTARHVLPANRGVVKQDGERSKHRGVFQSLDSPVGSEGLFKGGFGDFRTPISNACSPTTTWACYQRKTCAHCEGQLCAEKLTEL